MQVETHRDTFCRFCQREGRRDEENSARLLSCSVFALRLFSTILPVLK